MSKIAIIAKFTLKSGKRSELVAGMAPMMKHVQSEVGTLSYVVSEDQVDPDVMWVSEVYADQEAVDAHVGSDVMKALGGLFGDLMAGPPELNFLTPVGGKGF